MAGVEPAIAGEPPSAPGSELLIWGVDSVWRWVKPTANGVRAVGFTEPTMHDWKRLSTANRIAIPARARRGSQSRRSVPALALSSACPMLHNCKGEQGFLTLAMFSRHGSK